MRPHRSATFHALLHPSGVQGVIKGIGLALSAVALLSCSQRVANNPSLIAVTPDWGKVTWESRYDNAKVAHIQLNAKSLLPGQLAVVKEVDATFRPMQGQEMVLDGGGKYGGYVFDNWDQLVEQLEALVGGITITQTAFYPENSLSQSFALTPDEQKELQQQAGALSLKITCELYQLKLKAKIPLSVPISVKNGSELIQYAPTGDTARLEVSRTGPVDPNDQRPGRTLVFLLVDPDNHTATLLQEVAPDGFFNPGRDKTQLNLVYQLGVTPSKTPIDHEILYLFDPVVGDAAEAKVTDPDFKMQWP